MTTFPVAFFRFFSLKVLYFYSHYYTYCRQLFSRSMSVIKYNKNIIIIIILTIVVRYFFFKNIFLIRIVLLIIIIIFIFKLVFTYKNGLSYC